MRTVSKSENERRTKISHRVTRDDKINFPVQEELFHS